MPGLFSSVKKDLKMFKELFKKSEFRPDGLKIYPTLVLKGTELEEMYKEGKYKPYSEEEIIELLAKMKKVVPKYVRIARVMRAIPKEYIVAGTSHTHLREVTREYMKKKGWKCRCIRCREVGFFLREGGKLSSSIELCRLDYKASGGKEIFLSIEDTQNDVLVALLRLRIPYKPFRKEINESTALVRELHVYGREVGIDKLVKEALQHKGFGRKLMEEAEEIARNEFGCNKMVVISGIGVREYFYKLGYSLEGPYVSKKL
jgi:elongator complex protein 3